MKRGDPFKGNLLNRLSLFKARPINRDASRVVEPSAARKRKGAKSSKKIEVCKVDRVSRKPGLHNPKKRLVKKDGTIVELSGEQA